MDFSDAELGLDSDWFGSTSKEERLQCFADVKEALQPEISVLPDEDILRFLKARCFDLDKSIDMLKNHFEFRRDRHGDHPTFDHYAAGEEALLSNYIRFAGVDKNFRPICIVEARNFPTDPWPLDVDDHAIIHLAKNFIGPILALFGHDSVTAIVDIDGFDVWTQFNRKFIRNYLVRSENHFPESSKRICVFNMPRIVQVVYKFAKLFMPERTVAKIQFCKDEEEILEFVEPEMLESDWGGSHVDFPGNEERDVDFRSCVTDMAKLWPENEKVIMAVEIIKDLKKKPGHVYFDLNDIREKVKEYNQRFS